MPRTKQTEATNSPAPSTMVGPTDDMGSHAEETVKATKAKLGTDKAKLSGKSVKLTIHPGVGGDMSDVLIGHNYVLNQYKRNVEVEMPFEFYQVLKDSVVTTQQQGQDNAVHDVSIPQYSWTVSD